MFALPLITTLLAGLSLYAISISFVAVLLLESVTVSINLLSFSSVVTLSDTSPSKSSIALTFTDGNLLSQYSFSTLSTLTLIVGGVLWPVYYGIVG